ncbi:MAG: C39 family peptidase [Chloroflexi bacterium]|nr:C39 family peptidase [Chloroflexota bacterium]
MRDLHDTQPSRIHHFQRRDQGLSAPPRFLFWGLIIIFVLVLLGIAGIIFGFREVLQPAQQQRIIDQLPFMSILRRPTPIGGVFPTLVAPADSDSALSLLDMPLDFAATSTAEPSAAATESTAPPTRIPPTATPSPTIVQDVAPTAQNQQEPEPVSSPEATSPTAATAPLNTLPSEARISGVRHQQQTWNNCGPATITMALSYYGWQRDQAYAGARLKPNREDKNVSPHELAGFVEEETFVEAIVRMGGTLDLLKLLVANGFPVVIETGEMFEAYDWIGHYRVPVAYDDNLQLFYFFDSFLGVGDAAQGVAISYAQVDRDWRAFNRTFIVVYEPQRESLLRALLDTHWDVRDAAQFAFDTAQDEARRQPQDAFAWLNMGTSLVALGRHPEAAVAFDQANRTGKLPWRVFWYQFGIFEAYFEVGRYDDVLSLARINLNNSSELEESYYWQGRVRQAQGKNQQAESLYRHALAYNPNFDAARDALASLN